MTSARTRLHLEAFFSRHAFVFFPSSRNREICRGAFLLTINCAEKQHELIVRPYQQPLGHHAALAGK